MNKKFSTLLVGALLAGGLFNTAFAESFSEANVKGGQYYSVKIGNAFLEGKFSVKEVSLANGVKGYQLVAEDGSVFSVKDGDATLNTFDGKATELKFINTEKGIDANGELTATLAVYDLAPVPASTYSAYKLNNILGNGFGLQICYQVTKDGKLDEKKAPVEYSSLKGNVFTEVLYAEEVEGATDNSVILRQNNKDGKRIILLAEQWGSLSNSLADEAGYKFAAVTDAEYAKMKAADIKASTFKITVPATVTGEPVEVVAIIEGEDAAKYQELVVSTVDGTNYLTTSESMTDKEANYIFTEGKKNNTYVKLGVNNLIDYAQFKDAVWNISKKNDKGVVTVAGPSCSDTWVPAAQVAMAYPEGQWLYVDGTTFVNRESGMTVSINALRKIDGKTLVFKNTQGTFTFTKVGQPGDVTIGYLNGYSDDALKQKAFRLGTPVKATGDTVYIARGEEGALYLSKEVSEAVEFRLKKQTWTEKDKTVDVIKHFTTYASAKTKSGFATDTINFYAYNLTDATTGLCLAWDDDNQKYVLKAHDHNPNNDVEDDEYMPLVFKNKGVDTYNLLKDLTSFVESAYNKDGDLVYMETITEESYLGDTYPAYPFCYSSKLYGAHNTAELVGAEGAYQFVQNDLFVLSDADAMQYVSEIQGDTIKLFRHEDPNYVIYEKKGFLGLENFLDPTYAEKNAAIYADNGAGKGTWRPEYLLAVEAEHITDGWTCPFNPEHNTSAWREEHGGHCADAVQDKAYMTGRYLVALGDSSKAAIKAGKKDVFSYQNYGGDKYYKLAFVPAIHIGDSLIINSTKDTIDVASNAFEDVKPCDFAFHYTDASRTSFVIETAYGAKDDEGKYEQGWVKYHNGMPVVTKNVSEAEVFELNQTSEIPTANESIEAEAGVQVIAGNGTVTVQGAAGKSVVITNILGKVVAETVLTSDNATIAVPAGIVAVAVEGEEAVKTIVK